jgi:DNA invertase Pin-like site-specific DNA recombinase
MSAPLGGTSMVDASLAVKAGRAAMYVRMSTEHQQYSTENQADAIRKYAEQHNLSIVKTFVDYGKSGLRLSSRLALIALLQEVESRTAQFELILVYDVSRWGRFQDADESAYYEYVCKRAGVFVHYCAEPFENDGSVSSALLKTIKRSMAGEYSRELSVKVFAGLCRLFELGYRQGGWAGFGFRRQLLDCGGNVRGLLSNGEHKCIQSDRVVLIPGPEEELSIIREIFNLFTNSLMYETGIARLLNERGIKTDRGQAWTRGGVHGILTNSKFIGTTLYNRKSFKLSKKLVENPSTMWMRRDDAYGAIVPLEQFEKAQKIMQARNIPATDENLLTSLRELWAKRGRLSAHLIIEDESMPCIAHYYKRFQYLTRAYALIGYKASRHYRYNLVKGPLGRLRRDLCATIKAQLRSTGATVEEQGSMNFLLINGQFTISIVLCYCNETDSGPMWSVRLDRPSRRDITIAARLEDNNSQIRDYYLFPASDQFAKRTFLTEENHCRLEVYRFETLDFLLSLVRRSSLEQRI